jgi:uncharacterized protein
VAMDVAPRLTFPDPRIDALRGTAAIERGPLVYCLEQADQAADVCVDELALDVSGQARLAGPSGAPLAERSGPLPGIGHPTGLDHTIVVEAAAVHLSRPSDRGLPYTTRSAGPPEAGGERVRARAIPYFQWDNRDGRAMRVWIPLHTTGDNR